MKQQKNNFSLFGIVWFIFISILVSAFLRANKVDSIESGFFFAKAKAQEMRYCMDKLINKSNAPCNLSITVDISALEKFNPEFLGLDKIGKGNSNTPKKAEKENKQKEPIKAPKDVLLPKNEYTPDEQLTALRQLEGTKKIKEEVLRRLSSLQVVEELKSDKKYNRKEWKHWEPYNKKHSCWSIREQALYEQAKAGSVVLLDSDKNVTDKLEKACSIQSGVWYDPYTNEVMTKPSQADVDHHVPLGYAHKAGGEFWDKNKKKEYANDLRILVVTSIKANREKGAKGPSEWMPSNKKAHCEYSKLFVDILYRYDISVTASDKKILEKSVTACEF